MAELRGDFYAGCEPGSKRELVPHNWLDRSSGKEFCVTAGIATGHPKQEDRRHQHG